MQEGAGVAPDHFGYQVTVFREIRSVPQQGLQLFEFGSLFAQGDHLGFQLRHLGFQLAVPLDQFLLIPRRGEEIAGIKEGGCDRALDAGKGAQGQVLDRGNQPRPAKQHQADGGGQKRGSKQETSA